MKLISTLIVLFLLTGNQTFGQLITEHKINDLLKQHGIIPQMISQHPNGEWFMSANINDGNKYTLIRVRETQIEKERIDTLDFGFYLNISKLSNDGDELLYGFLDTLGDDRQRRTYLRTYIDGQFSEPTDFRDISGLNACTYFMLNDRGDVYFYTYDLDPKGIYKINRTDKGYSEPKLLLPNKSNYVPFSPLLLDENTMIMAQHGQGDNSVNGIYVSKNNGNQWSLPVKIEGLPYGWSLGFGEEGNIVYLEASSKTILSIDKGMLQDKIRDIVN